MNNRQLLCGLIAATGLAMASFAAADNVGAGIGRACEEGVLVIKSLSAPSVKVPANQCLTTYYGGMANTCAGGFWIEIPGSYPLHPTASNATAKLSVKGSDPSLGKTYCKHITSTKYATDLRASEIREAPDAATYDLDFPAIRLEKDGYGHIVCWAGPGSQFYRARFGASI